MVIQSKFVDYYDYISRTLGADPLCVYERKPLAAGDGTTTIKCRLPAAVLEVIHVPRLRVQVRVKPDDYCSPTYTAVTVVVGYMVWPVLLHSGAGDPIIVSPAELPRLAALPGVPPPTETVGRRRGTRGNPEARYAQIIEHLFGKDRGWPEKHSVLPTTATSPEQLDPVLRAVGAPVFALADVIAKEFPNAARICDVELRVHKRIPVLKDLGLPAYAPPTAVWQEIARVLTSVLRKDPDKQPPCVIANDDRVEAAGFDLVSSFRHPVKWRR